MKTRQLGTAAAGPALRWRSLAAASRRSTSMAAETSITPSLRIKSILVPIDFSDCSRTALQYAVSLARSLKASLVLLYVAETNPAGSELGPCHLSDLEADLRQMAKRQLAQLTKQEVPAELLPQTLIRAGRADSEILEAANTLKVGLIIMATHSKDSLQGQLGATASRVASLAACPVMLVPVKEACLPFFL